MGLNTSFSCWDGPYSSFNQWRNFLASQIGINLDDYFGYGKEDGKDLESIDHDLMPLFNHSDCDGQLTVEEAKRILNGLNQVLENWKTEKYDHTADYMKQKTVIFRDGCIAAIAADEPILFM